MDTRHNLTTSRLIIRPWISSDAPQLTQAANFRSISKMTAMMPFPYTEKDAQVWIRKTKRQLKHQPLEHIHFAVTQNNNIIGAIGADRDGDQAEIGYWLTPKMQGQGMMTEAVKSFITFVFKTWPVKRLIGKTFTNNFASQRVLLKSGFTKSAVELKAVKKDGHWRDVDVFVRYVNG